MGELSDDSNRIKLMDTPLMVKERTMRFMVVYLTGLQVKNKQFKSSLCAALMAVTHQHLLHRAEFSYSVKTSQKLPTNDGTVIVALTSQSHSAINPPLFFNQ